MVFSRFRQRKSSSSRNQQEQLAQLEDTFPDENPQKLEQALNDANGNFAEAVQSLNGTRNQRINSPTQPAPRKLQRPAQRQHPNSYPTFGPGDANMSPSYQRAPPPPNNWNVPNPGPASPQHQPNFAPLPPHAGHPFPQYQPPFANSSPHLIPTPPQYQHPPHSPPFAPPPPTPYHPPIRDDPPSQIQEQMRSWPSHPMPLPPYPSSLHPPTPWAPNQPPADSWSRPYHAAVPPYEMPPPDLLDYDMSWMVGLRMLSEWDRSREDMHWDQVRRARGKEMMGMEETCLVM